MPICGYSIAMLYFYLNTVCGYGYNLASAAKAVLSYVPASFHCLQSNACCFRF